MVTAPAKRLLVRMLQDNGVSERRALRVAQMSASALRYTPRPESNLELRQQIVELAQRHRRYGADMIYLKLRQAGHRINHKRVERLYALEKLQVRRRRREKIQPGDRQALIRLCHSRLPTRCGRSYVSRPERLLHLALHQPRLLACA